MLLSFDKKFIFIHVPKTAGSSIGKALEPYSHQPTKSPLRRLLSRLPVRENAEMAWLRVHDKATWIRRKIPREFAEFLTFAVVRNPYDYAVSYYHYIRDHRAKRFGRSDENWSFRDFLNSVKQYGPFKDFRQSSWVVSASDEVIVDQLLRFESLSTDFAQLASQLGLAEEVALPHENKSEHRHYLHYYTQEDLELANTLFRRDFQLLGYPMLHHLDEMELS